MPVRRMLAPTGFRPSSKLCRQRPSNMAERVPGGLVQIPASRADGPQDAPPPGEEQVVAGLRGQVEDRVGEAGHQPGAHLGRGDRVVARRGRCAPGTSMRRRGRARARAGAPTSSTKPSRPCCTLASSPADERLDGPGHLAELRAADARRPSSRTCSRADRRGRADRAPGSGATSAASSRGGTSPGQLGEGAAPGRRARATSVGVVVGLDRWQRCRSSPMPATRLAERRAVAAASAHRPPADQPSEQRPRPAPRCVEQRAEVVTERGQASAPGARSLSPAPGRSTASSRTPAAPVVGRRAAGRGGSRACRAGTRPAVPAGSPTSS